MATISVQTKKFSELEAILSATGTEKMLIHDGNGVKVITVENLHKGLQDDIDTIQNVFVDGAGAHSSIYRGKYLGSSVTAEQYAAIADGTFADLYIGDYWTISGVNYRIAAFDYFLYGGDTECTKHHAVIVPEKNLYSAQMNTSNTTTGGYVGSAMYTTNLAQAKTTIKAAFSGHILTHREWLVNAVSNGKASGGGWFDSDIELMTEQMVYGACVFNPVSDGSTVPANYRISKMQLPLFAFNPTMVNTRQDYWLRDVITAASFANVHNSGLAHYYAASYSLGVRPAFCIS